MSKRLTKTHEIVILSVLLIVFALVARLAPHPPNFAPITAIALLGGAILPRKAAIVLPLLAIILSDMVIGFHDTILWTWGSFALIALAANGWLKKLSFIRVGASTLFASLFFFMVTNFGVWMQGFLYPRTLEGLGNSYVMALPFFRNTLLGDLIYTGALFGAYYLVSNYARSSETIQIKT